MRIGIGTSIVGGGFIGTSAPATQYLDEVGGTPTAAYSVDKVVSTYTDAVVEVRRTVSAVTVEADVAFDGDTITLDSAVTITSGSSSATTLGEFVAASGYSDPDNLGSPQDAFVATWYDQAGSNDATQTTAANQPKIVSAGALVTENGKVALDFDGSNDGLFTSAFAFSASSVSAFVVYKNGSTSGQKNIFRQRANGIFGTQNGYIFEMGLTTSTTQYGSNTAIDDGVGAISASASGQGTQDLNQHLESLIYKSDEILAYQDGNLNETLNNTSGTTPIGSISMTQSLWIGRNFGSNDREYDGLLQELIIYNSDKSALRTDIEGNINDRFSIYP